MPLCLCSTLYQCTNAAPHWRAASSVAKPLAGNSGRYLAEGLLIKISIDFCLPIRLKYYQSVITEPPTKQFYTYFNIFKRFFLFVFE